MLQQWLQGKGFVPQEWMNTKAVQTGKVPEQSHKEIWFEIYLIYRNLETAHSSDLQDF